MTGQEGIDHDPQTEASRDGEEEAVEESNPQDSPEPSAGILDTNGQISVPKRDIKDLSHPPKRLAEMRRRMFEIQEKIELQVHEFEEYWPYIDNVWVRQHKAPANRNGQVRIDYYVCRLQRPTYTRKKDLTLKSDGEPLRKKQIREGGTCQMRMKVIRFDGGYSSYTIVRIGDHTNHSHDLDYSDRIKRNSAVMEIAKAEIMKGGVPLSVYAAMTEDPEKLAAVGGQHLKTNDIRNKSQAWRQSRGELPNAQDGPHHEQASTLDPSLTQASAPLSNTLQFTPESQTFLQPYLPSINQANPGTGYPFVTLTYATSMDSSLALAPGLQTILSGPWSKSMTHFLRSKHDAILIGVGTALADNPGLNCRLEGVGGFGGLGWEGQPRPVIIDPGARWPITPEHRILRSVRECKGRAPWIVIAPGCQIDSARIEMLKSYGGQYLGLTDVNQAPHSYRLRWEVILQALAAEGIRSVMIEGGGTVINELLKPTYAHLINSVVVTIAPTYLGTGGVAVRPAGVVDRSGQPQAALRFKEVKWQPLGEDVVMCGKLQSGWPGVALNHSSDQRTGPA
ncbi:2,5-diamino-6-(ribosylamino)-4(3H)-pyrimidinone 5'-phosphate reductase [Loxospora ochrophaea]|nr:2,5-diamino-6-(ribosylamino)-4(3H)-pyrimidinone 5'-phosphate reductase [Loxospora ochrophaea]